MGMAAAAIIVGSETLSPHLRRDDNARIAKRNLIAHVCTNTNGGIVQRTRTEKSVPSRKRDARTAKNIFTKNHLHAILEPTSPSRGNRRLFKISTMFKICLCVQREEERCRCLEACLEASVPCLEAVSKPDRRCVNISKYYVHGHDNS